MCSSDLSNLVLTEDAKALGPLKNLVLHIRSSLSFYSIESCPTLLLIIAINVATNSELKYHNLFVIVAKSIRFLDHNYYRCPVWLRKYIMSVCRSDRRSDCLHVSRD